MWVKIYWLSTSNEVRESVFRQRVKKPATTEWEFLTLNPKGVDADWCRFTRLTVGMCNYDSNLVLLLKHLHTIFIWITKGIK